MKSKAKVVLLLFSAALVLAPSIVVAESPMEAFGALVEGRWTADDSRHEFEWGVGRRAVRARSYHKTEQGWTLVGEGMWFWDPAQQAIRGVVVAIAMPVDLFEYRSEVRDNEIVHELAAHGPAGGKFVERWRRVPLDARRRTGADDGDLPTRRGVAGFAVDGDESTRRARLTWAKLIRRVYPDSVAPLGLPRSTRPRSGRSAAPFRPNALASRKSNFLLCEPSRCHRAAA